MRIGILTFHCAHNYGAVLQCYALQETLRGMGHEVVVIDYRPEYLLTPYRIFSFGRIASRNLEKGIVCELLLLGRRIARHNAFNRFIEARLSLSSRVGVGGIPMDCDVYVFGSDQIWNPKITRGFDPIYFGEFGFPKGNRLYVAYAASMEANELSEEERAFYVSALRNFDSVSVRESQLAMLLQPLAPQKVKKVLDPTLLAGVRVWDVIAVRPHISKRYVLVYQVRTNPNILRIASEVARSLDAVVVEVTAWLSVAGGKYKKQCASPEEFLGWIKYASCVVTTSFHGTAFSVIFNRPFYSILLGDGSDTRSASLLRNIGLEDRAVSKDSSPVFSDVDFSGANERLAVLRKKSEQFLVDAINCGL